MVRGHLAMGHHDKGVIMVRIHHGKGLLVKGLSAKGGVIWIITVNSILVHWVNSKIKSVSYNSLLYSQHKKEKQNKTKNILIVLLHFNSCRTGDVQCL